MLTMPTPNAIGCCPIRILARSFFHILYERTIRETRWLERAFIYVIYARFFDRCISVKRDHSTLRRRNTLTLKLISSMKYNIRRIMAPTNSSFATSNIGASLVDTRFQFGTVSQAESSLLGIVDAPLVAASGHLCTMPYAESSLDGIVSTIIVAASVFPRTFQATTSLYNNVGTSSEASRT